MKTEHALLTLLKSKNSLNFEQRIIGMYVHIYGFFKIIVLIMVCTNSYFKYEFINNIYNRKNNKVGEPKMISVPKTAQSQK